MVVSVGLPVVSAGLAPSPSQGPILNRRDSDVAFGPADGTPARCSALGGVDWALFAALPTAGDTTTKTDETMERQRSNAWAFSSRGSGHPAEGWIQTSK